MSTAHQERTDSIVANEHAPHRKKFPWWLLVVALAVIALVAVLLTRGGDDAGDGTTASQQEADSADGTAAGEDASGSAGADTSDGDADGAVAADDADVRPGMVTAGGATVYPLSDNLTVGDFEGEQVIGRRVPVESVVAEDGFWVGTEAADRIFVRLTGDSALDVRAGDTIDFEGVVSRHGRNFAQRVGVERDEGARRLTALRGHIQIPGYRTSGE